MASGARPPDHLGQVGPLVAKTLDAGPLIAAAEEAGLRVLGQFHEPGGMAGMDRRGLTRRLQLPAGEIPHRVQHLVPGRHACNVQHHQRLRHQATQQVEHGPPLDLTAPAHLLDGRQGGAPIEDAQAAQQHPLGVAQPGPAVLQRPSRLSRWENGAAPRRRGRASRAKRLSRRAAMCTGPSTAACAAANSMASGMPSRRRQLSATIGALSAVRSKPGAAAAARSQNNATAS